VLAVAGVVVGMIVGLMLGLPHHITTTTMPTPAPTQHYVTCTGQSSGLPEPQCSAWQDFYRSTKGGSSWEHCQAAAAATDPCSCTWLDTAVSKADIGVRCSAPNANGSTAITGLSLFSLGLNGTLPASLSALTDLTGLDVRCNENLYGDPPPGLNWKILTSGGSDDYCNLGGPSYPGPGCPSGEPNAIAQPKWHCPFPASIPSMDIGACFGSCTPQYGTCIGQSATLATSQCNAWQDLWHGTGGSTTWHGCNTSSYLLDPCSCSYTSTSGGPFGVACSGASITKLHLTYLGMTGTLPSSLSALTDLTQILLHCNGLSGQLPDLNYNAVAEAASCYIGGSGASGGCASGQGTHTSGNTGSICPADGGFTFSNSQTGCFGTCTSS
jgi:hypothetical protein